MHWATERKISEQSGYRTKEGCKEISAADKQGMKHKEAVDRERAVIDKAVVRW